LSATSGTSRDRDRPRADKYVHRGLSGKFSHGPDVAAQTGRLLARSDRALPGPDGIRGARRRHPGARRAGPVTSAACRRRPLRGVRTMCGIFGAIARRDAPLRHPEAIPRMAAALRHRGPDGESRLEGMFGLAVWGEARRRLVLARDRAGEKPLFWSEVDGELRFASEIQALLEFPDQARRLNRKALSLYHALGYVPAPHTMFDGIHKLPPASLLIAAGDRIEIRSYWSAAEAASRPATLSSDHTDELRETLLRAVERELMSDVPLGV